MDAALGVKFVVGGLEEIVIEAWREEGREGRREGGRKCELLIRLVGKILSHSLQLPSLPPSLDAPPALSTIRRVVVVRLKGIMSYREMEREGGKEGGREGEPKGKVCTKNCPSADPPPSLPPSLPPSFPPLPPRHRSTIVSVGNWA